MIFKVLIINVLKFMSFARIQIKTLVQLKLDKALLFLNEKIMLNRALRLLRTYHHFSQVELAKKLQISNSYLSEIESGDKNASIELLDKYSVVFKMPLSSIILFSELNSTNKKLTDKISFAAADKILRLLEWIEDRETIEK